MTTSQHTTGRRTKLTPEVQEKIVSVIRAGNYCSIATEYAGITRRTYFRWLRRGMDEGSGIYWDFAQAVQKAESEAEIRAVATIQQHMTKSWQAAMTFLERKYPERWGRKSRIQIETESDPREALSDMLGLSLEEVDRTIEAIGEERANRRRSNP